MTIDLEFGSYYQYAKISPPPHDRVVLLNQVIQGSFLLMLDH